MLARDDDALRPRPAGPTATRSSPRPASSAPTASGRRRAPGLAASSAAMPTGRTAWRTVIPIDNAPPRSRADRVGLWLGPKAHLVHYPVAQGAAVNVVAIVEEAFDKPGWAAQADYRWIAERFRDWCPEVRDPGQRADAMAEIRDQRRRSRPVHGPRGGPPSSATRRTPWCRSSPRARRWRSRTPPSSAAALAAKPDDVPAAFAAYAAERKPRVAAGLEGGAAHRRPLPPDRHRWRRPATSSSAPRAERSCSAGTTGSTAGPREHVMRLAGEASPWHGLCGRCASHRIAPAGLPTKPA